LVQYGSHNGESKKRVLQCAACGAAAAGKYCPVCDKRLSEDYQPLDTIRSGYRLQRKTLILHTEEPENLFEQNKNHVSQAAWACLVYSLVPYLGMLFVPLTVVSGSLGYVISLRRPQLGGGRMAIVSLSLSVAVFGIQLGLWWLLYIIPELNVPPFISSAE
jgi:hypothetical protein